MEKSRIRYKHPGSATLSATPCTPGRRARSGCHTSCAAGKSRHTSTRRTTSWAAVLWQDARNSSVTSRTDTTSLRLRRGGALCSTDAKAVGVSTSRPPPTVDTDGCRKSGKPGGSNHISAIQIPDHKYKKLQKKLNYNWYKYYRVLDCSYYVRK
jgi:hypothetical protein